MCLLVDNFAKVTKGLFETVQSVFGSFSTL